MIESKNTVFRYDIINALIKHFKCEKYLEIGFQEGINFREIQCTNKLAIDPNPFEFNVVFRNLSEYDKQIYLQQTIPPIYISSDEYHHPPNKQGLLQMTSDSFFESNIEKFDCVFIDGLHTFEQVKRDFLNAWNNTTDNAVIILHDMNPATEEKAISFNDGGVWNGDCYKMAFLLNQSDLFYTTIDEDHGTMFILKEGSQQLSGFEDGEFDNSKLNYSEFDSNRSELLNLVSFSEFIEKM